MFIFKGIREIASLSSRITTKNKNINSWQNKFCVTSVINSSYAKCWQVGVGRRQLAGDSWQEAVGRRQLAGGSWQEAVGRSNKKIEINRNK